MFRLLDQEGQMLTAAMIVVGIIGLVIITSALLFSVNSLRGVIQARQLTEATLNKICAEKALSLIKQTPAYMDGGSVSLDSKTCFYNVEDLGADNRIITVSSTIDSIIRTSEIVLTVYEDDAGNNKINIRSWEESP